MPKSKKIVYRDILDKNGTLSDQKNYFINRVGEFGTIAKLSRYGIDAFLTHGNKKSFDIIATANNKSVKIQVKATKEISVPTRFFQTYYDISIPTPDFWVLVHSYAIQDEIYREQYYVLKHSQLMDYHVKQLARPELGIHNANDLMVREQSIRKNKEKPGVDKVFFNDIPQYDDKFKEIFDFLHSEAF
ncbi:hypothetical protein MHB77_08840 [Paenibacillus sp. FSL K6-3166]|uniref:hypothetical protein n=1 Tax=unclassified Paenibacillus TaxID=185978 RepID=UPI000BA0CB9A|nr:hypothetical protein [Paenibacillus sp. VTT E-133291]MBY3618550.1 hypothetical protein [Acinetobacter sp. CUI P1]OZQ97266.1 hypothetical protein CA598_06835 [Paenibacillus sp. VTT E-133291]